MDLFAIVFSLLMFAAGCVVLYLIVKAAVAQGIKDALWNMEISMRNAVKNGVKEALAELEENKTKTEKSDE